VPRGAGQEKIDESRPRDLDPVDQWTVRECCHDRIRGFARLASERLGQQQCHVAGKVAMLARAGPFDHEIGSGNIQRAAATQAVQRVQQQIAEGVFHGGADSMGSLSS
jgi:hypothetical protein